MQQRAVIFDADGVLVDSYEAHLASWQRLAQEEGRCLTEQQFAATFGRTSREVIRQFWPDAQLSDERIRAIDSRKEQLYRALIASRFPVMPGAAALIESLKRAGFALAVGTSGPPENLALLLDHFHGDRWFGASVSGADVLRGKPDPQVFLLAAERLGVAPARCAVVEDAAPGIAAARAAGMLSIGLVSHGHTREELSAADHVVAGLDELSPEHITRWLDDLAGGSGDNR